MWNWEEITKVNRDMECNERKMTGGWDIGDIVIGIWKVVIGIVAFSVLLYTCSRF